MHETPSRDRGDGRATRQPSHGTAGLDLRRTCSVRRKVSLSCLSRARRGESVEGRPEDARLPAPRDGAAPEAGRSAAQSASGASTFLRPQKGLPGFPREPRRKARPLSLLSIPRLCVFADLSRTPSGATIPASHHPNRAYCSERRTARSAVAAGGSCIMRAGTRALTRLHLPRILSTLIKSDSGPSLR
jgi:hypothetical protein